MSKMAMLTEPDLPPRLAYLKDVEELLRCPICFDYLNISMMTKCSHNFCSLCIRKYLSYKLLCPVCDLAMTEVDLRNNRILDDLVASFRAARQPLSRTNLDSPLVSPKTLCPDVKRKTPNAMRPVMENTIMSHFLQKGDSLSSPSSLLSKKPKLQSACSESWIARQNPLQFTRAVKVEVVKLPLPMTRTVKVEEVEVPAQVTRTVKVEEVEVPAQVTRTVKKERVDKPAMGSLFSSASSSESPSTSLSAKAMVKVECPVCMVAIQQKHINKHLDSCLIRDEKKDSLRSSVSKRKPLTKLAYNLLSVQELRKRLREVHLPTQGSRDQLVRRHQEFVHMYNAECDSLNPKSAQDIAKEVEKNEKMMVQLQSKSHNAMVFSTNQTEEEIQELHSNYRKKHCDEFSRLIAQVKGHLEASKQGQAQEDAQEGGSRAEGGHPSAIIEEEFDTEPCVSTEFEGSFEETDEDMMLKTEPIVTSLSPAYSDISSSSSISDVFNFEAERNNRNGANKMDGTGKTPSSRGEDPNPLI